MTFTEVSITTVDGTRLYSRRFPADDPRAEVIIVHGFGEHSGRYTELIDYLTGRGYTVTTYDHRGHGRSDGLAGHVDRFSDYEADLDLMLSKVRSYGGPKDLFIIGHSMGGLVALRYLATAGTGIAGAVISAPLIAIAAPVPAHKLALVRVSARVVPRLRLGNEIDPANLSRDPEVGRAYAADPLVNRVVSAKWFSEATRAMSEINERASKVNVPLLVMHGTDDRLASVEATRQIFDRFGSEDKELIIYDGFYHELFNEPEKWEIYDAVVAWLDRRTGPLEGH